MSRIAIVADSTCDLSEELLTKYEISICPLHVHLGEDEFIDGVNITPKEYMHGRMNTKKLRRPLQFPCLRQRSSWRKSLQRPMK